MTLQYFAHVFCCPITLSESRPTCRKQSECRRLIAHTADQLYSVVVLMQKILRSSCGPPVVVRGQWIQHGGLSDLLQRLTRLARMGQRIPEIEEEVSELRIAPFGFGHHCKALVEMAGVEIAGAKFPKPP